MRKKLLTAILIAATSMSLLAGCGSTAADNTAGTEAVDAGSEEKAEDVETSKEEEATGEESEADAEATEEAEDSENAETSGDENADMSDEERAKEVADLIDSIYVQERTDETDELCEKAKAAWDALSDEQKEMVEGEEADPDYFGRDTGDASKDDSLNADDIGENEILVVSFGTSFNDSRVEDISGIEQAIAKANPDWSVRRAFTAQIIINHVQARDGEKIDNVEQALDRAVANGVKKLVVQPTHLMHGAEYDELTETLEKYTDKFDSVSVAEPLLGEVGNDATVINEDKKAVACAITEEAVKSAGFDKLEDAAADGTAFVFMGHGTAHTAKVSYSQMATQMKELGYENVFIGTVEGEPEDTACDKVIEAVKEAGYTKVVLRPLMVVAGDHANNDMAGDDDDSWKSMFEASGAFESVDCQIEGLGRIDAVKELYVAHTKAALDAEGDTKAAAESAAAVEDGEYQAKFTTDSSMFKVNETCDGMGTLTVKDGKMTIHITLPSENIVNLFTGVAEDAAKDGAELLMPTKDEVKYDDGTTETVNGFDVPVPYLDKEFDLALIGTKGKWYDHKVVVETPAK
ncbi:sirohydrochlorin cobaltochelatase [Butyrivibrio sp. AE3004]|uniref:sirohydrochlorin cobaltochelatase n=1 Tax=Butyrivibrio sp. AE3004 TaxID=1506994 RepID=UPI00068B05DB|nr:sirohydrochlorin cobaltochelatase [Butyrivibrio sp. AE3004]